MSHLLIDEPPLQVIPSLAAAIGLNEAIVLQQLHYWQARSTTVINGRRWVYNTIKQWNEQFPFWSDDTIARTMKKLREMGLVIAERLSEDTRDRSLYYRIDSDCLSELTLKNPPKSAEFCDMHTRNLRSSHTRNLRFSLANTETTTERSSNDLPVAPLDGLKKVKSKDQPSAAERKTTMTQWLASVKANGEQAIPDNDPVFAYASKVGIPHHFLRLAWLEFRDRYTGDGEAGKKRYVDWRKVYGNAVRSNWFKLWWINADGQYALTTAGQQADRNHGDAQ